MKKLMLVLLFIMLPLSVLADYPKYLFENPNIEMTYGRMGYAQYLDKSSLVVEKDDSSFIAAVIQYTVDYEDDLRTVKELTDPNVVLYYYTANVQKKGYTYYNFKGNELELPPYVGMTNAYVSMDMGKNWKIFDHTVTASYNLWAAAPLQMIMKILDESR